MGQQRRNAIFMVHAILGNNRVLGSRVYIYTYAGATTSVSQLSSWIDGACGVPCWGSSSCSWSAPGALRLKRVCGFYPVPFWQARCLLVWFLPIIARCLSIAAFTLLCLGNPTPHFFPCRISAWGFWLIIAYPLSRHVKILLWPFLPYSRQDACGTIQAVPNLLVLP